MGTRPLLSVAVRRFIIDVVVLFVNKEDESAVKGGVVNLQTICEKSGQRNVPKQRGFLCIR